jgi:hypothetical protein
VLECQCNPIRAAIRKASASANDISWAGVDVDEVAARAKNPVELIGTAAQSAPLSAIVGASGAAGADIDFKLSS